MIEHAETANDLDEARLIFREYAASLDFSLEYQGFEDELRTLPGRYARPGGCILLARERGAVAGCVAMRPLPQSLVPGRVCEMKRLFVRPAFRGRGVARHLCQRLVDEARASGYDAMWLDTESTMIPAVTLYRSLGFRDIPRYNDDPMPDTIYLGLELKGRAT